MSINNMNAALEEDSYLRIQLLSYDQPKDLTERFYFLEMSTLQATTLINPDFLIRSSKIVAYRPDNEYLTEQTSRALKSIGDFNTFFISNPDYYIHHCELKLECGIEISSHDDGEVSIEFPLSQAFIECVHAIFEKYKLGMKVIDILKGNPGHYIAIDKQNNITGNFKDFDDYLKNGRY